MNTILQYKKLENMLKEVTIITDFIPEVEMNIRFLIMVAGGCLLVSPCVFAQFFGGVSIAEEVQSATMAKPISLLEDVKPAPSADEVVAEVENLDPDVSYYVQKLDLNEDQLQKIREISANGLKEKEDILQKAADLRRQARALEISMLSSFEEVLNDSQKEEFRELRAEYKASQGMKSVSETAENNASAEEN